MSSSAAVGVAPRHRDSYGVVFRDAPAVLLARVVDADGQPVQTAGVASITYTVRELDEGDPDASAPVAGHEGVALVAADTVFDALQTDALWTLDAEGYNFRHDLDVSEHQAFVRADRAYQVRYELTPVSGPPIVFRFLLRAI